MDDERLEEEPPTWVPGEDAEIVSVKGPIPLQGPPPAEELAPLDPLPDPEHEELSPLDPPPVAPDSSPDLPPLEEPTNGRSRDERPYIVERRLDEDDHDLVQAALRLLAKDPGLLPELRTRLNRLLTASLLEELGAVQAANTEHAARKAAKLLLRLEGHHTFVVNADRYRKDEPCDIEADFKVSM